MHNRPTDDDQCGGVLDGQQFAACPSTFYPDNSLPSCQNATDTLVGTFGADFSTFDAIETAGSMTLHWVGTRAQ